MEEQNQKEWTGGAGGGPALHMCTSVHDVIQAFSLRYRMSVYM